MFSFWSRHLEKKELKDGFITLIEESSLKVHFLILTFFSALMATLGLIMNNVTVLIGAMLIAPLLTPVISLSIGVGAGSVRLIWHAFKSLGMGIILVIVTSAIASRFLASEIPMEAMTQNFSNGSLYFLVSLVGGAVAVYCWFKPNRNQIIPGVGIAVTLVPPLSYLGMVLVFRNQTVLIDTLQLIVLNLAGMFLGGLIVFWALIFVNKKEGEELESEIDEKVEE